ncbi:MAG TPA: helix-turn-helix transcriptional regulator [Candidatus Scatomorpha stercoravium]|nr:helix-turn-helix transcriptional regulator [Candidatus Scatomorpha stercoravium]
MVNKTTGDVERALAAAGSLDGFLSENEGEFTERGLQELLGRLFDRRGISKAALAKESGMSEIYLHQIFAGRRSPSRGRLISLSFGLRATLEETQELLRRASLARLYARRRRDAIIIYGLTHGLGLFEVNDKLFTEGEETLF